SATEAPSDTVSGAGVIRLLAQTPAPLVSVGSTSSSASSGSANAGSSYSARNTSVFETTPTSSPRESTTGAAPIPAVTNSRNGYRTGASVSTVTTGLAITVVTGVPAAISGSRRCMPAHYSVGKAQGTTKHAFPDWHGKPQALNPACRARTSKLAQRAHFDTTSRCVLRALRDATRHAGWSRSCLCSCCVATLL